MPANLGCDMRNTPGIGTLIYECWQQLFQLQELHNSLAELEKTGAHGWGYLDRVYDSASITRATSCPGAGPDTWRKWAEEARALADITAEAQARRSLAEIAASYEAFASSQKISGKPSSFKAEGTA